MKELRTYIPLAILVVAAVAWRWGPELMSPTALAVDTAAAATAKAPTTAPAAAPSPAPTACPEASAADAVARAELGELCKRDNISPLLRTVARAVKPAVVEVRISKMVREPEMDDMLRRFFRGEQGSGQAPGSGNGKATPRQRPVRGLGSGVIIDAEKGYVITNYHVVGGADKVEVVLSDHRVFSNEWIRTDPMTDLAVIKLAKPEGLTAAPLGDSNAVETGDLVLAIGSPSGLAQTVTMGIISATGRAGAMGGVPGSYQDYIQTDAAINRGNSGGPLVNMRGEVIGLNNMILSSSGGNEGVGLAVPAGMIRYVMDQLIAKGKVTRGFLGVGIQDADENLARSFKLPGLMGALVTKVVKDSPAGTAGLKSGDFIVAIDGRAIASANQLRNTVAAFGPGRSIGLEIYRDGVKQTVEVKLGELPKELAGPATTEEAEEAVAPKGVERFGLELANLNEELAAKYSYKKDAKGVVITDVKQGSDAAEQGLVEGMMILQVGSQEVTTAAATIAALSDKSADGGVRLLVSDPQGGQRFVFVAPSK